MSEEDNKPGNTDTTPAPDTTNTLPETSLSLEDDTPAPTADVPPAETPSQPETPKEPASGLEMDTSTEASAPVPEAPAVVEPPSEATGGLEMDTPTEPVAPEPEAPATVEPPAEATSGLEMDTATEPATPALEETAPVESPAETTSSLEMDTSAEPVTPPTPEATAPATPPTEITGGLEMDTPTEAVVPPTTPTAENIDNTFEEDEDAFDEKDGEFNEEDSSGETEHAAPAKRSKIAIVGGVVLTLAVAGAGGYYFLMGGSDKTSTPTNIAATTTTTPSLATASDIPSDLGFAAPPQPQAITTDTTSAPEAIATAEVTPLEEDNNTLEGFEGFEETNAPSETDITDEFEAETADNDAMESDEDIWGTEDIDQNTEDTVDGFSEDDTSENTASTDPDNSLDPLSEPPVATETDAVAFDDLATPEEENVDVASVENTDAKAEATADSKTSDSDNIAEDTPVDATEGTLNEENNEDTTVTESDPLAEDGTDTASLEEGDVELPEFDPIPEDEGPQIMDTPEAPPQLGFEAAIETAESDTTEEATENTEEATDLDAAIAPTEVKEPQGDLANVVPDLPLKQTDEKAGDEETETSDAASGTGTLKTDKQGSHRDQLKEVPAQEAIIRPLPKKYLIIEQNNNTEEQQAKRAMRSKSPNTALGVLDKMTAASPNNTDLLMKRAIAAQRAGQNKTALSTYEKILKKNPSDLQALTNMLGLLHNEKPQLALSKLSELRELYPDNPGIAAQLAVSHGSLKNYKEALKYFDIAASLDVPNAYYPFSKGVILDRMGHNGEATTYYRQALKMYRKGHVGSQKVSESIIRKRLGLTY